MSHDHATLDAHYDAAIAWMPPDHVILMDETAPITFGELQIAVRKLATGLRAAGAGPGSLVGYSIPNGLAAFALPLAISRLGSAFMPLHTMVPDEVRCGLLARSRVDFAIVGRESVESFRSIASGRGDSFRVLALEDLLGSEAGPLPDSVVKPEHPLLLCSSSGTTGVPKPVFLSQRNVASALTAAYDLSSYGPWTNHPAYRAMIAFPQSTSGIMILLGTALLGVCQVFTRSLSPARFLEIADETRVEAFSAPPAWLEAILSVPVTERNRVAGLKGIAVGMDFLAPSLLQRLGERFPAFDSVANGYGLVETATVFMVWKGTGRACFEGPTSVLSPCDGLGNEISVRDEEGGIVPPGEEGELWVRGPSAIERYLGSETGFEDGWFRTGDVVRNLGDGRIELRGRRKYLIKRGGKSVSPLVVQEAVDQTPGVLRSAVVGIPHPLYGEMVWAFVVPRSGEQLTTGSVMKTARGILPTHMVPDRVEFVDRIPQGQGVGKIDRETLIARGTEILQTIGV